MSMWISKLTKLCAWFRGLATLPTVYGEVKVHIPFASFWAKHLNLAYAIIIVVIVMLILLLRTNIRCNQIISKKYVQQRLPKKIYRRFPLDIYFVDRQAEFINEDCAICIYPFEDGELLRVLPTCRHNFHSHCIAQWFSNHDRRCPLCKHDYSQGNNCTFDYIKVLLFG